MKRAQYGAAFFCGHCSSFGFSSEHLLSRPQLFSQRGPHRNCIIFNRSDHAVAAFRRASFVDILSDVRVCAHCRARLGSFWRSRVFRVFARTEWIVSHRLFGTAFGFPRDSKRRKKRTCFCFAPRTNSSLGCSCFKEPFALFTLHFPLQSP